jgi:hypothetical protein
MTRCCLHAEEPGGDSQLGEALPVVPVMDVSAAVLATVLDYVYSDALEILAASFFTEQGAEQLFDAADRYLIFPMKVQNAASTC